MFLNLTKTSINYLHLEIFAYRANPQTFLVFRINNEPNINTVTPYNVYGKIHSFAIDRWKAFCVGHPSFSLADTLFDNIGPSEF